MASPPSAPAHDRRIPPRERCVLRYLLDDWAAVQPDKVAVVFEAGGSWTYAELRRRVRRRAAGFQRLGVSRGDHVALWMPTSADALEAFYAINYLGAVFTPFNTAFRGRILEHVIDNAQARLMIVHADLVERLNGIDTSTLETLVICGAGRSGEASSLSAVAFADTEGEEGALEPLGSPIEPWDLQSIIYTSGTTGPSKGVLSSYMHLYSNAGPDTWTMVTGEDRFLVNSPIFHIGGMGLPAVMLARGGSIVLSEGFSTDRFWDLVRRTECTAVFLLGVMATFLLKQPPGPGDLDHKVRLAFMVPLTDGAPAFRERFGVDIFTIFNMTEISSPIVSEANPVRTGTCGKPRPGVEVRLVDANDVEVALGSVGEMIVRTDRPWAMNSGYNRMPQATAAAWRNGWFHTGDAFRQDEDGYFYFVDRVKDAIRRRGENISSFEVEVEVCAHRDVREAAVIGAPSEYGEDDVMAVVAPVPGAAVDPVDLFHFLKGRLPYFMTPRYIRVLEELPKTPSAKVMKAQLRGEGVTADTWDSEKCGLRVRREVLS
jgi:crotonobetaine/carnitine-CoA ligase